MIEHWSDCAVHNMPAYPNGPCDCGAVELVAADLVFDYLTGKPVQRQPTEGVRSVIEGWDN